MPVISSPRHTFVTAFAEQLSTTDDTVYAAVCVIWRVGNAGAFHLGGPQVTNTEGGQPIGSDSPSAGFWINVPVRLTQLYVAGIIDDVVDLICIPPIAVAS